MICMVLQFGWCVFKSDPPTWIFRLKNIFQTLMINLFLELDFQLVCVDDRICIIVSEIKSSIISIISDSLSAILCFLLSCSFSSSCCILFFFINLIHFEHYWSYKWYYEFQILISVTIVVFFKYKVQRLNTANVGRSNHFARIISLYRTKY
jgi:hypothetical protein